MFSNLATKLAMRKMGIPSDAFNFPTFSSPEPEQAKKLQKTRSDLPPGTIPGLDEQDEKAGWPAWMSVKALPLTVQPWLSPPPAPIPIAECPKVGDLAPIDRDRKITVGGNKKVLIVFLRCVGCAFAQKTFLALRTLANRYANNLTCIAVSHSSPAATHKWMDLLGGAWNVQVVIDEDRAVYAAWGLGLGSVWYVLNPSTQAQAWRETGWLGKTVAGAIQRRGAAGGAGAEAGAPVAQTVPPRDLSTGGTGVIDAVGGGGGAGDGPGTVMGNKWQQAGAFAVDGRGKIVWGRKALRADDVLDLDEAVRALML